MSLLSDALRLLEELARTSATPEQVVEIEKLLGRAESARSGIRDAASKIEVHFRAMSIPVPP